MGNIMKELKVSAKMQKAIEKVEKKYGERRKDFL